MLIRVDPSSAMGLADQIAASVRSALGTGTVQPGETLPPARQVAAGLDVNMHTVLRAYQTLRDEGLIDLRRGRGAVVRPGIDPGVVALHGQIEAVAADAVRLGWDGQRTADAVRAAVDRRLGSRPDDDPGNRDDQEGDRG